METVQLIAPVALWCIAALAVLLFGLGMAISRERLKSRQLIGAPDDPESRLLKLVRAQGNTAEYAGILAVMIAILGTAPRDGWVTVAMAAAVVARYLFVAGMVMSPSLARPQILRGLGAAGTYVAGCALAVALIVG